MGFLQNINDIIDLTSCKNGEVSYFKVNPKNR